MKPSAAAAFATFLLALPPAASGQSTVEIGSGPVSETIRREFFRAFYRGNFQNLTSLPPLGDVKRLGSTGLVQEFANAAGSNSVRYALVRANSLDSTVQEGVNTVLQMTPELYTYFGGVGPNTAGYPTTDTQLCPSVAALACTYQIFDKNHALFVFTAGNQNGANFNVKDPFFTRWRAVGIGSLGPVLNAEEAGLVSSLGSGSTATVQRFSGGALYNFTAGTQTGRLLLVSDPIYSLYVQNRAEAGFLGMPTSEALLQSNGRRRQTFEGGAIEYEPGQTPELRLPVNSVAVSGNSTTDRLNLGDTVTLRAQTYSGNGGLLEGRSIAWVSTNSRVLTVDPASGPAVTVRAVGGGAASITAVSEGKSSRAITLFVTAPCCQIGEGAPNSTVQQSFVDAVTRNRLAVRLPSPSPVRRSGAGFVQELAPVDPNSTVRYLLAKGDESPNAYLVTGPLLAAYLELGGPSGSLGFPAADPSAAGRQLFAGGALAGTPTQLVAAPILARWAQQNYESGPAGLPRGGVAPVLSFLATLGSSQSFAGGAYVAHRSGSLNGRAFLVSGVILAKFAALGGAAGTLGLPTGDEFAAAGRRRQDFEGGLLTYAVGDAEATLEERTRRPQIGATPGTVAAGSRIRIAAGGFDTGATLRITTGNQPEFIVKTDTGAYAWEVFIPANAGSGLVTLRAADVNNTRALAVGSYVVQSGIEVLAKVTKLGGDLQSGVPGARLPLPISVRVTDENNVPLAGLPVRFNPSPGAQIEDASAVTDDRGQARAWLRLPLAEAPALATAEAGRQVVTFAATSRAGALPNYPRFDQTGLAGDPSLGNEPAKISAKGALLATAASMLRYLQGSGELGSPNGLADPVVLNAFLRDACVFDAQGAKVCDGFIGRPGGAGEKNVNPWRLALFVNGSLDVAPVPLTAAAGLGPIRDSLALGAPVLLALSLDAGQATAMASHFVAAIGVAANGDILVHDPNPAFRRNTLSEYLRDFNAGGRTWRGALSAALRLLPQSGSALGFLIVTDQAEAQVVSPAGACGFTVSWPDTAAAANAPPVPAGPLRFSYCDGVETSYQLDVAGSGQQTFLLTDLGTVAGRFSSTPNLPGSFQLTRPASNWTAAPQRLAFSAAAVLNAATFTTQLSPGTLASVFGNGLAGAGSRTAVSVDGSPATVLASTPFQVNFQIPPDLAPGLHTLLIESPFGVAEQQIALATVSPGVFTLGAGWGAIVNQNGTVNSATTPASRGEVISVYGTGFGALRPRGALQVTEQPVTGTIEGQTVAIQYSGAAPGFPGLYQINISLPQGLAPGIGLRLVLGQGDALSQPVLVAVQ